MGIRPQNLALIYIMIYIFYFGYNAYGYWFDLYVAKTSTEGLGCRSWVKLSLQMFAFFLLFVFDLHKQGTCYGFTMLGMSFCNRFIGLYIRTPAGTVMTKFGCVFQVRMYYVEVVSSWWPSKPRVSLKLSVRRLFPCSCFYIYWDISQHNNKTK